MPGDHPGHFVRQWRKFRGYSQEQLAEMIGVTHGAISQLERGLTQYTQPLLEALADALQTDPPSLLIRDPTQNESIWSLWDRAKPAQREKLEAMAEIILKDGTNG